jgi:hypothetical protein
MSSARVNLHDKTTYVNYYIYYVHTYDVKAEPNNLLQRSFQLKVSANGRSLNFFIKRKLETNTRKQRLIQTEFRACHVNDSSGARKL